LQAVGNSYGITFSDKELKEFSVVNNFGLPIEKMKSFLALSAEDRDKKDNALGIPADSANNQLSQWVKAAHSINVDARIAIKGDQKCNYPVIKNIMNTLRDLHLNRYNLITSLEEKPKVVNF
jgi:biopolymer transport protein ExbD